MFLLYLGAVVAISTAGGPVVGVCVAVVAFLVVNWLFTEPLHTLNVADPERLAELIIFLAISGTVASLVDTASRRRGVLEVTTAENEELTAANDLRTALLRAVSHDLRTPLTTAKLATSSLLADDIVLAEPERTELLHLADREIDRLVGIVENLLDAGRLQAGALTVEIVPLSLQQVAAQVVATADVTIRGRLATPSPPTCPRRSVMRRCSNASSPTSSATPPTPTRRTRSRSRRPPRTTVVSSSTWSTTAPACRPSSANRPCAPFHRIEDRGSSSGIGLGLPICAGFCDAMGAELVLLDTPGGGLTARVRLERAA